ncbi:unnamed protein product [Penicillium salamii]|nr:unnamed protein product [Penicillium salamii]CAG8243717.1 unnamed protein product [Penicillium salamii]
MASIPTSQSPVCGRPVGIGEMSPETPPHHASAGIMEEGGLNEMEVSDAEEEAQQDVTGKNPIENRPAVGSSSPSLYPVAGISYPTPFSNSPDTPVTTRRVERSAEVTTSDVDSEDRTVDKRQSACTFSKLQPTVEDAPDDAELDNPETSSINDEDLSMDEDFGDSDIESALEDTVRFLQDTSCNSETPSTDANTSVNTESNPKSLTPVSISPAFNESDQHKFPNGEQQTNSSQETLEYENRQILQQKRKLPAGLEPHSTLYTRNLRPRLDKGKGGNQAPHDDEIAEDVGKNSSSEGVLADSVAKNRADSSSVAHLKTSVPSNSDKDKWSGPLLCHSLLSTLSSEKKAEIERKCNRISRPDLPEFMEKHTKSWKATGFWDSPRLDVENHSLVSSNTKGFAIWRYVDAMQTGEETHYLKSRLADIMLYLAYIKELRRQKDAGHPPQTAKVKATDIICGTASLSKAIGERTRKSFHEHKLVGERWWWSGCHLGRGFFLLCSQETGKKIQSKTFSLDAFILYVLWNCQHIIACCDKFEQLVDGLLTGGEFTEQLTKKEVQLWIREAKAVSWKDTYIDCWKPWSTNAVASKASEFLTARSSDPEHPR